jgi:hypothetical protein
MVRSKVRGRGQLHVVGVGKMVELILEVGGAAVSAAVDVRLVGRRLDPQEWCGCWCWGSWSEKGGHVFNVSRLQITVQYSIVPGKVLALPPYNASTTVL